MRSVVLVLTILLLAVVWPITNPSDSLTTAAIAESDVGSRESHEVPLRWTNVSGETGLWSWNGDFFAWADYDEDGDQDLLVNGARLLENGGAPNWTFTDVTAARNISGGGSTGAWGDMNGDGHLDLYLGGRSSDVVLLSQGAAGGWAFVRDEIRTAVLGNSDPTTVGTFRDINNDGLLDLYVGGGEDWNDGNPIYYSDHLFFGSAFTPFFVEQTTMLNPDTYYTRGVSWGDGNRDGWSDLYVGNYRIVPNRYYSNIEGALNVQLGHPLEGTIRTYSNKDYWGHTIASAWGDLTGDGYSEVISANLVHLYYDSNDIRGLICDDSHIYTHDPIADSDWTDLRPNSNISFGPRGGSGVYAGDELYAGVALGDIDLDGDLDMWLPQVYNLDYARAEMWVNDGTGFFTDRADEWGIDVIDTYGGAFVDYDNDGDLDLVTGGRDGVDQTKRIHLYRNELIEDGGESPVTITVEDASGATAFGAAVESWSNGTFLGREEVRSGEGPHGTMPDSRVRFPGYSNGEIGVDGESNLQTNGSIDLLTMWPTGEAHWSRNLTAGATTILAPSPIQSSEYTFLPTDTTRTAPFGEDEQFSIEVNAPSGSSVEIDMGLDGIIDWSTDVFQPSDSPLLLSFPNSGRRVARLLALTTDVSDDNNQSGGWLTFTSEVVNSAPIIHLNYTALLPGVEMTFDASGTIDSVYDHQRLEYRWDFDDGPFRSWNNNATFSRIFDAPGDYDLTLRVRDAAGELDRLDVTLNVTAPPPVANFTLPDFIDMDSVVNPSVVVEELGYPGESYEYKYDWGDGSFRDWYSTISAYHWWTESGQFNITLTIRDGFDQTTNYTHPLTVLNPPPEVAWWTASSRIEEGEDATFQVIASDTASHDQTLSFTWILDTTPLVGQTADSLALVVSGIGNHTISVNVTDAAGAVTTISTPLEVIESSDIGADSEYNATLIVTNGILIGNDIWYSDSTELSWQTTPSSGWSVLSDDSMNGGGPIYRIELMHVDSGEIIVLSGGQQRISLAPTDGVDLANVAACDTVGWHPIGVPLTAEVSTTLKTSFGDIVGELPLSAPFQAQTVVISVIVENQEMSFTTIVPAGGAPDTTEPGSACEYTIERDIWRLRDGWFGSLEGDLKDNNGGSGSGNDGLVDDEIKSQTEEFALGFGLSLSGMVIGGSVILLILIGIGIAVVFYIQRSE
jgi:hypothetical protein